MGDVNVGSAEMRNFKLGTPALVCRWRLASGRLPLENRHLRALSRRVLDSTFQSSPRGKFLLSPP